MANTQARDNVAFQESDDEAFHMPDSPAFSTQTEEGVAVDAFAAAFQQRH